MAVQELPRQRLQVVSAAAAGALCHAGAAARPDGRAIRPRLPELVLLLLWLMMVVVVVRLCRLDRPLRRLRRRVEERGQVDGGGDASRRRQVRDGERALWQRHLRRGRQRRRGRQLQRGEVCLQVGQLGLEIHHLGNDPRKDVTFMHQQ